MALTIITKKRFENKVKNLVKYLLENWYDSVADDFIFKLDNVVRLLSLTPHIGKTIKNFKNTRSILITNHNRLYYRIEKSNLILVNLIDTRRNPKTNPFKKK